VRDVWGLIWGFSVEMVLFLYSFAAEVGIVADLVVRSDLVVSDLQAHCAGPDATVRTVRPCKSHREVGRLRLELCRSADGKLFASSSPSRLHSSFVR
jgi:hypothetical protein